MANIRLRDVLDVTDVRLDLDEPSLASAVIKTAELLREHPSITDWQAVSQQLGKEADRGWRVLENGVCIPHVRTNFATGLAIAVSRLTSTLMGPCGGAVKHIFVIVVPTRHSSEYLRVVGAIARVFKNLPTVGKLDLLPTPTAYLKVLEAEELRVV